VNTLFQYSPLILDVGLDPNNFYQFLNSSLRFSNNALILAFP